MKLKFPFNSDLFELHNYMKEHKFIKVDGAIGIYACNCGVCIKEPIPSWQLNRDIPLLDCHTRVTAYHVNAIKIHEQFPDVKVCGRKKIINRPRKQRWEDWSKDPVTITQTIEVQVRSTK